MYDKIKQHPDVETPAVTNDKEINFFSNHFVKGYYWYQQHFDFSNDVAGEYSVNYLIDSDTPERMYEYNPELKLIVSLRDPLERAFSEHKQKVRQGLVPEEARQFGEALPLNPSYLEQGRYAKHLRRYLRFFPEDQLLVLLSCDFRSKPGESLESVYDFIGVDSTFTPSGLDQKQNVARDYRSPLLNHLLWETGDLLRNTVGNQFVSFLKSTGLPDLLRSANRKSIPEDVVPPPRPEIRARVREELRDDIEWVERFSGRDLSDWCT